MFGYLITRTLGFWPIRKILVYPVKRQLWAFDAATKRPREVQEALLRRILVHQADTDFGRDHGFKNIRQLADFRRQLPVARYEYFEPYINRVRRGDFRALLADPVVHMFAMTSGTTATRKFIPVTPQYLEDYRRGWHLWGLKVFMDHPEVRLRPILYMCGDHEEFHTEAGIPCGAITGLTATMQKRAIRWLYCVPVAVSKIKDIHAKYYTALRLSMPRKVAMIIAANPSTLINMARTGHQEKEALIRDLYDGTLSPKFDIPAPVRSALGGRLKRHKAKAQQLEAIVNKAGTLYPVDYWWPHPFLIGTWTGGSVGQYVRNFARYYGDAVVRDVGLIASEGRMTVPMADGTPSGVLDVTTQYFEFIPEEEVDRPNPTVLAAHEVQEGKNYFILLTTSYGLYRYNIYDLVRVTGFHNGTPTIEFLSKGSHFANITGEKLSEYHVTTAMKEVMRELDLSISVYSLAPCWSEDTPYYGLFVERDDLTGPEQRHRLIESLDRRLAQINSEYAGKRESQRLDAVRLEVLPGGTWKQWDRQRLAKSGGAPEQYKHPCLIPDFQFRESMPVEEEVGQALAAGRK